MGALSLPEKIYLRTSKVLDDLEAGGEIPFVVSPMEVVSWSSVFRRRRQWPGLETC